MLSGLEFPEELFSRYLAEEGASGLGEVGLGVVRRVFIKAYEDFKKEKLSFDLFSSVCERLWSRVSGLGEENSELGVMLEYGLELSWYVRNDPQKILKFLEEIEMY